MRYGRYRFNNIVLNEGRLTGFSGSALRGAFGHALKEYLCIDGGHNCSRCNTRADCLYAKVFEVMPAVADKGRPLVASLPHPYVLVLPEPKRTPYSSGDAITFELLLFGDVNNSLMAFIQTVDRMGRSGVRTSQAPVRFALSEVLAEKETIYRKAEGTLRSGDWTRPLLLSQTTPEAAGILSLNIQTPLRIKSGGRYCDQLPFPVLVRAMLRRVRILTETYGAEPFFLDHQTLLNKAEDVVVSEQGLYWRDYSRHSQRQKDKMKFGGISGEVRYQGQIGPFLPLLDFCRQTHLGKQTSFGLGQFDYTWQEGVL